MKVKDLLFKMLYKNNITDIWIEKTTDVFHSDVHHFALTVECFGDNDVDYWYIEVDRFDEKVELYIRIK